MIDPLPDGIYFDLDEDVYHAIPRLSASGICNLLVSPATFWARSWLNARRAVLLAATALAALPGLPDGHQPHASAVIAALRILHPNLDRTRPLKDATDSKPRKLGRAYHCTRLEPDTLHARFCRKLDPDDFEQGDAVWTGAEIEKALAAREQPMTKKGETVADKGRRLREAGFEGLIWPLEVERWQAELGSRTPIDPDVWDDLLTDMEWLRESECARLLVGGVAEVTVLWTDAHGIKMKCRIDYLRPDSWTDLKTFDNSRGVPLEDAMLNAFRFNRHYVQAHVYREAVELMRNDALPIIGPASGHQRQVIGRIAIAPAELECWFIYCETKGVPNINGRRIEFFDVPESVKITNTMVAAAEFATADAIARVEEATRTKTFLYRKAAEKVNGAKSEFIHYSEIYPTAGRPWLPWKSMRTWNDLDFPDYFLRTE